MECSIWSILDQIANLFFTIDVEINLWFISRSVRKTRLSMLQLRMVAFSCLNTWIDLKNWISSTLGRWGSISIPLGSCSWWGSGTTSLSWWGRIGILSSMIWCWTLKSLEPSTTQEVLPSSSVILWTMMGSNWWWLWTKISQIWGSGL